MMDSHFIMLLFVLILAIFLGFELINRHQLSAYHVPEGIFIGQGPFCEKYFSDIKSLDTISFAPWICKMFNIKKPEYMSNL
mgnify:CR=1 FL=1